MSIFGAYSERISGGAVQSDDQGNLSQTQRGGRGPKKPGVEALLSYGKEHGYLLGLATSSRREYSTHLLQDGGIWDYFDAAVFGDMVTHAKPDPEIYQKACEALGAAPQEAVALEDSPNGIRSAHAAGMRTIVVPDLVQPDGEIRRLCTWQCASLADVIDLLNA